MQPSDSKSSDPKKFPTPRRQVSCVICCHNSSERLPETLRYLARQKFSRPVSWEVIVVDNGSTDDTSAVAVREWPGIEDVPFTVIFEPTLGTAHARMAGFRKAQGEIVSMIDDDNWVREDWVQNVSELMEAHPDTALLVGHIDMVTDVPVPAWFHQVKMFYAITRVPRTDGPLDSLHALPSGAGMSLRKAAIDELIQNGFHSSLDGRKGASLECCEDLELALALKLYGWRFRFSNRLYLQHFMPQRRLQWSYARRLLRAIGSSSVFLDAYLFVIETREGHPPRPHQTHWLWRLLAQSSQWALELARGLLEQGNLGEGNRHVALAERHFGRMLALWRLKSGYHSRRETVARMPWVQKACYPRSKTATLA